jgi:membrane protein implicated in regulation of membrane protease activity
MAAVVSAAVAAAGVIAVSRYRAPRASRASNTLDVGQTVVFERWISEGERLARVRYRNATWDARVLDAGALESGRLLHIRSVDGSTLQVSIATA